jgi:hypothetical protein
LRLPAPPIRAGGRRGLAQQPRHVVPFAGRAAVTEAASGCAAWVWRLALVVLAIVNAASVNALVAAHAGSAMQRNRRLRRRTLRRGSRLPLMPSPTLPGDNQQQAVGFAGPLQ